MPLFELNLLSACSKHVNDADRAHTSSTHPTFPYSVIYSFGSTLLEPSSHGYVYGNMRRYVPHCESVRVSGQKVHALFVSGESRLHATQAGDHATGT